MKEEFKKILLGCVMISGTGLSSMASEIPADSLSIPEVVVTGARSEVDLRHLPMSVSVVNKKQIEGRYEQSLLPVLTELVPGLFTTSASY